MEICDKYTIERKSEEKSLSNNELLYAEKEISYEWEEVKNLNLTLYNVMGIENGDRLLNIYSEGYLINEYRNHTGQIKFELDYRRFEYAIKCDVEIKINGSTTDAPKVGEFLYINPDQRYEVIPNIYDRTIQVKLFQKPKSSLLDISFKINRQLKKYDNGWVKINGQLRQIDKIFVKINGELKQI